MTMTNHPRASEFFKFYLAFMVATAVFELVPMLLWGFNGAGPAADSAMSITMNIVQSLLGLAVLILSIIAIIKFVKQRYPKTMLVLPIGYFVLTVISFVFGAVYSIMRLSQQFEELGANPDPAEIQRLADQLSTNLPLPIVIFSIAHSLILLGLVAFTWFKSNTYPLTTADHHETSR